MDEWRAGSRARGPAGLAAQHGRLRVPNGKRRDQPAVQRRDGSLAGAHAALPLSRSQAATKRPGSRRRPRSPAPRPHPGRGRATRGLNLPLPARDRLAVVHGDFRVGNVIFGADGLRSVLDWELTHIGDPMEDLGWLCTRAWRFGSDDKPVGGIGRREELFRAYEAESGGPVDPARVRFWEIFGNVKWGVICMQQARTHLDGKMKSVELASLGRRTAETEWELLDLIEEA